MIITSERISLKHLLTAEALTDREVMGLIRRAGEFKQGQNGTQKNVNILQQTCFLKIVLEHIKVLR